MPPRLAALTPYALALALGTVGGALAAWTRVPLAWMLGPLVFCAVGSIAGLKLTPIPYGREFAQAMIGVFIGLRFTPPVLAATLTLLPAMAVSTLYVFGLGMAAAVLFQPMGRTDRQTAFYATAMAGVAEMVLNARQRGADAEVVSVVQSLRVALVVLTVPFLVIAFGADGGIGETNGNGGSALGLVAVIAAALLAGFSLSRLRGFPNPWMFGPLTLGIVVGAAGFVVAAPPWLLLVIAQIGLGTALGCRFDRSVLARLPRVAAAGVVIAVVLILGAALGAAPLTAVTGLSYATSFLALAPAGVTEMVLTARLMHLDPAAITAFHVVRIVAVNGAAVYAFLAFDRLMRRFDGPPNNGTS
jgi:membrane AbrB-like protein